VRCAVTSALQGLTDAVLLAAALQADRLRTQEELQVAQERSRSLGEELSLIRSTLLPLLSTPAATAAVAAGAVPASQPGNASLAALAQVMQQQQQAGGCAAAPGSPMAAAYTGNLGFDGMSSSSTGGGYTTYTVPYNTPTAAVASAASARQYNSTVRAGRTADPALEVTDAHCSSSPVAASPSRRALEQYCSGGSQQLERATPQRGGGGLAGLVSELQSDVDKLQQQLHSTRRQLHWDGRQGSAVEAANGGASGAMHMHHNR
jgi:hypothetical protein